MDITSLQNPRVKHIVKLREDKRQRQRDGLMLVEGYDEIQLALSAGHRPQTLFHFDYGTEDRRPSAQRERTLVTRQFDSTNIETLTVSRAVFEKMSYRENPDGWLAIFPIPQTTLDDLQLSDVPLIVIAESIEKPGNIGAMLRTADAAHVDAFMLCDPRVDLWNPNVVRASRGALFSVPVLENDNGSALAWLKKKGIQILAATPSAETLYFDADMREPIAIAVGTEDKGLTDFWMQNADMQIKIPMLGKVNSLNVSVSTALILYEALRQRS